MIESIASRTTSYEYFYSLRKTMKRLSYELYVKYTATKYIGMLGEINMGKLQTTMNQKIAHYEATLNDRNKKIQYLESTCKRIENEYTDKLKKYVRKYIDAINDKDLYLGTLRKQIVSLKTKISNLYNDVHSNFSSKATIYGLIMKSIEQLKGSLKEFGTTIDESHMDQVILNSKYRQINEKVELLMSCKVYLETKNRFMEDSMEKLKQSYKDAKNENLDLKFELEQAKVQIQQQGCHEECRKKIDSQPEDIFKYVGKILEMANLLTERGAINKQVYYYCRANAILTYTNEYLKQTISKQKYMIDQLNIKLDSSYENKLLAERYPSLYEYMLTKKEDIGKLYAQIERLEDYIDKKDKMLTEILEGNAQLSAYLAYLELKKADYCAKLSKERSKAYTYLAKTTESLQRALQRIAELESSAKQIAQYRKYIQDILKPDSATTNGKKKKHSTKSRCLYCMLHIDKNYKSIKCSTCSKLLHDKCEASHTCEDVKKYMEYYSSNGTNFLTDFC